MCVSIIFCTPVANPACANVTCFNGGTVHQSNCACQCAGYYGAQCEKGKLGFCMYMSTNLESVMWSVANIQQVGEGHCITCN